MLTLRSPDRQPTRRSARGRTVRTVLCSLCSVAVIGVAAPGAAVAQTPGWSKAQFQGTPGDPEQGRHVVDTTCAACHGKDGNSSNPQYPKLAGQNPAYLYQQLWAFATGARSSPVMSGIAGSLSKTDAADVASFYGQQTIRPDPIKDPQLASLGQRIFFAAGGPATPACAMCHGSSAGQGMMGGTSMMGRGMMGMMGGGSMADIPNINGQHAAYTLDQLNRFASGERQGTVMNRIAASLSETDKKAVAEFVSGVP